MGKEFIVIHHSATPDGRTFSVPAIWDYHVKVNGWSSIGYHWILDQVGDRMMIVQGRPTDSPGAHCKDAEMNTKGIGVCLVGNYDEFPPSDEAIQTLNGFLMWLMRLYKIPVEKVIGHREAQAIGGVPPESRKTCPGKSLNMRIYRDQLAIYIKAHSA